MYEHNLTLDAKSSAVAAPSKSKIKWIANILTPACLLLASLLANAGYQQDESPQTSTISSDFNEPVTLDSKNQNLDGKRKISVFTENVIIMQGSLKLLADRVELDATAGKNKEVITAQGNPATYSQRQDDGTMVVASANEIIYSVESRTISLKGNASIDQNEVQVSGNSIVFDMAKEQIVASTGDGNSGSVRTVISPGAFDNDKKDDTSDNKSDDKNNNDSPK